MNTEDRPVLTGLVALVTVALVIGVLGGLGIMVAVKATGIGGSSDASDASSTSGGFYLPQPTDTSTTGVPAPEEAVEPGTETPESQTPAEHPDDQRDRDQGDEPGQHGAVLGVHACLSGDRRGASILRDRWS